jgi:hypothetical protein
MNFITGNKFKSICDYILDEKGFHKTSNSNSIPIYFIKTDYIGIFLAEYQPKVPYKIITHNSNHHVTHHYKGVFDNRNLISWWGQNIDFDHPRLKSIPIGIANEMWPHGNEYVLSNRINSPKKKNKIIYANFSIDKNKKEKAYCSEILKKQGVVLNERTSFPNYLDQLSSAFFCISPKGNGIDSHRIWESLYLKTIPIVTESVNGKFYENYPIYKIKSWDSFDSSIFDENLYHNIMSKYDSYKLDIDYYYNLILSND